MRKLLKLIMPALLLVAVYYAVFGGEYSVFELRRARESVELERDTLALLQRRIDSLTAWADSLRSDSATLERIAREQFGMIRDGETLYRFAAPSDSLDEGDREFRGSAQSSSSSERGAGSFSVAFSASPMRRLAAPSSDARSSVGGSASIIDSAAALSARARASSLTG